MPQRFKPIEFKPTGKFVYAVSDGIFNSGHFDTIEDALADAKQNWPDEKCVSVAEVFECDFKEFLSADAIIQNALEVAGDHTTEYEISKFDELLKKVQIEKLQEALIAWSTNFEFKLFKPGDATNFWAKSDCDKCKSLPEGEVVKGHDHRNF